MISPVLLAEKSADLHQILGPAKWLGLDRISEYAHALTYLLGALDWRGKISQICEALPHMPGELDRVDLINTMVNLGFHSKSTQIDLSDFDDRLAPCLFISDDQNDQPGIPLILLPAPEVKTTRVYNPIDESLTLIKEFKKLHGTVYIFIPYTDELAEKNTLMTNIDPKPFTWFRTLIRRFDSIFIQTFAISFLINILALASSLFVMVVYDKVIGSRSIETLEYLVFGALMAIAMEAILRYLRARSLAYFGVRIDAITSQIIFERLLFLPPRLIEGSSIPSQVARIKDFDSIREFFSGPTNVSILELPFTLIFISTIALIGGPLALIPLILAGCYLILAAVMMPKIQVSTEQGAMASIKKQALLVETMRKIRALKAHGLSEPWWQRFHKLSGEAAMTSFSSSFLTSLIEAFAYGLSIIAGVATLTTGIFLAWDGRISTGALIACMMLVWRVLTPMQAICNSLIRIRYIFRSINQVHKLVKTPPEGKLANVTRNPIQLKGQITFNGVGLRYTGDRNPVFSGLNLDVKPGEAIAVAGRSGSGKSSLLKMINGLYTPQVGSILIDGLDIRQRDLLELRKSISYVPQIVELFHGTIEKNLRMAKPDASDQDLYDALTWAGALEEVRALPRELDTFIGDYRSEQLSSNFAYRLSLARGYLRDAPVMLFDEFPSAVVQDRTGQLFREYMEKYKGRKTILYVTERTADVQLANRMVYLPGNGQVLAGEPDSLISALQA